MNAAQASAGGIEPAGRGLPGRVLLELRLAAAFLTILPVSPSGQIEDDRVADSFAWFPAIGFALGALLALEEFSLHSIVGVELRSALLVMTLAILTGAVHLDGLADTADAFGAGRDRTRALEILHDSRIGSFGAIALFFVLALKVIALSALVDGQRSLAIWFAPAMARWAMVATSFRIDYLRPAGAGTVILRGAQGRNLAIATATIAIAIATARSLRILVIWLVAMLIVALIRTLYRRWLGGVTGDLVGAAGEAIETIVLIAMSV